jgi:hypothetical protein
MILHSFASMPETFDSVNGISSQLLILSRQLVAVRRLPLLVPPVEHSGQEVGVLPVGSIEQRTRVRLSHK